MSHSIRTTTEVVLGNDDRPRMNHWYDQEYSVVTVENYTYRVTLQPAAKQVERYIANQLYKEIIKNERSLFRRKKLEQVRRECEELEMHYKKIKPGNYLTKIRRQTERFECGASSCRAANGNLVTDA